MRESIAFMLSLILALSCGRGALEDELTAIRGERDALTQDLTRAETEAKARDDYVASVSVVMNEVADRLARLRQEHIELVTVTVQGAERGMSRHDQRTVRSTMEQLDGLLAANEEQIVLLEDLLRERDVTVLGLDDIVKRLRVENDTLTTSMTALHSRAAKLTIRVRSLESEVAVLEHERSVQGQELEKQTSLVAEQEELIRQRAADLAIAEQERALVYYVVGTVKELKAANILEGGGRFGGKGKLNPNLNTVRRRFHRGDRRELEQVDLGSIRHVIEILPSRPKESYRLDPAVGDAVLKITKPAVLWQIRYLVVVVKR